TSYNVFRSTTSTLSLSNLTLLGNTPFNDAEWTDDGSGAGSFIKLNNGTTYYYAVVAVGNNGALSGFSNVARRAPNANVPSAPANLTAIAGNGQVSLSWTASPGAEDYFLFRYSDSPSTFAILPPGSYTLTANNYLDTGLTNGTTYYYFVYAEGYSGYSPQSNEAIVTPSATAPPFPPTGLTATAGNGQVSLNWTASSGAAGYSVLRSTNSTFSNYKAIGSPTANNYIDTGLSNGTTYYYEVESLSNLGGGAYTSKVSATPALSLLVQQ